MKFSLALKKTLLSFFTAVVLALSIASFSSGTAYAEGLVGRQESPAQVDTDTPPSSSEDAGNEHLSQLQSEDFNKKTWYPESGADLARNSVQDLAQLQHDLNKVRQTRGEMVYDVLVSTVNDGDDAANPKTFLPIGRWNTAVPVAACDTGGFFGGLKSFGCQFSHVLSVVFFNIAAGLWSISYHLVDLVSGASFLDGGEKLGPFGEVIGGLVNTMFDAFTVSLIGTGVFAIALFVVFVRLIKQVVSGKKQGAFRLVLMSLLPLVAFTAMATAISDEKNPGDAPGSPIWVAKKGLQTASKATEGIAGTLSSGAADLWDSSSPDDPNNMTSCSSYLRALREAGAALPGDSELDNQKMLSNFWMTSYVEPLVDAQFGTRDLEENRVWCHLLESESGKSRAVQASIGALAGYPDPSSPAQRTETYGKLLAEEFGSLGLGDYSTYVDGQFDPYGLRQYGNNHSKLVAANFWQACVYDADADKWLVQPSWRDVSEKLPDAFQEKGTHYTDEACESWWYLGDGSGHLQRGGLHDIWPAPRPAPETVLSSEEILAAQGFENDTPEDVYRHTKAGFNSSFFAGLVTLGTSVLVIMPVVSLSAGTLIASIAFAALLALLPVTLILLVIGRDDQNAIGKRLIRATMSFAALTLTFKMGMAALIFMSEFVQNALNAISPDGALGSIGSLLSPLVAVYTLKKMYSKLGFGSLTSPTGAAAAVFAAGAASSNAGFLSGKVLDDRGRARKAQPGERMASFRKQAQDGVQVGRKKFLRGTMRAATSAPTPYDVTKGGLKAGAASAGAKMQARAQALAARTLPDEKGVVSSRALNSTRRARAAFYTALGHASGARSEARREGLEASRMGNPADQARSWASRNLLGRDKEAWAAQKSAKASLDQRADQLRSDAKANGQYLSKGDARALARKELLEDAQNSTMVEIDPVTGNPYLSGGREVKMFYREDPTTGALVRVTAAEAGARMVDGELVLDDGFQSSTNANTDARWSASAVEEIRKAKAAELGISPQALVVSSTGAFHIAPPVIQRDESGNEISRTFPANMSQDAKIMAIESGVHRWTPEMIAQYNECRNDDERTAYFNTALAEMGLLAADGSTIPANLLDGRSTSSVLEVLSEVEAGDKLGLTRIAMSSAPRGLVTKSYEAALQVRADKETRSRRSAVGRTISLSIKEIVPELNENNLALEAATTERGRLLAEETVKRQMITYLTSSGASEAVISAAKVDLGNTQGALDINATETAEVQVALAEHTETIAALQSARSENDANSSLDIVVGQMESAATKISEEDYTVKVEAAKASLTDHRNALFINWEDKELSAAEQKSAQSSASLFMRKMELQDAINAAQEEVWESRKELEAADNDPTRLSATTAAARKIATKQLEQSQERLNNLRKEQERAEAEFAAGLAQIVKESVTSVPGQDLDSLVATRNQAKAVSDAEKARHKALDGKKPKRAQDLRKGPAGGENLGPFPS